MTKLFIDSNAGLCPGVKLALTRSIDFAQKREKVFSYGELIHNPGLLSRIQAAGIQTVHDLNTLPQGSSVIIRAHGIPPEEEAFLQKNGIAYLDLTCSIVKKIHHVITQEKAAVNQILIIGKPDHPETIAHLGYAGTKGVVVKDCKAAEALSLCTPCLVVAQTTTSYSTFLDIVTILKAKTHMPNTLKVKNTVCLFVKERQEWIRQYAGQCAASIIIGGRQSSNTAKLYEIATQYAPAVWIENQEELDPAAFAAYNSIALTAGTSTPEETVNKVIEKLYSNQLFPVFIG